MIYINVKNVRENDVMSNGRRDLDTYYTFKFRIHTASGVVIIGPPNSVICKKENNNNMYIGICEIML